MSRVATTTAWDLRWRPASGGAWSTMRVPYGSEIAITSLPRGEAFQAQIRAVAASGKSSPWVDCDFTVGTTNRTGAAALPNVANQQAMWDVDTSVTFAASSDSAGASVATISVSAGTLVIGDVTVEYGASSATLTGTAGDSVTVYLYYDDPDLAGGTLPLGVTTNIVDSANAAGRVAISTLTFTYPAAGGSSSGGGGIGGGGGSGGACPSVDAWVIERERGAIRAGDVRVGDWLQGVDGAWVQVTYSQPERVPGVQLLSSSGAALTCSTSAPILTAAGVFVLAECLSGQRVRITGRGVEPVTATPLGVIDVQHISCAGEWARRVFLVGDDPGALYPHHNAKAVIELEP